MRDAKRFYAGIGSRETLPNIMEFMTELAKLLEKHGFVLRSGGAPGADTAFEVGVSNPANKEIYLPWIGFQNNPSDLIFEKFESGLKDQALEIVKKFHPASYRLGRSGALKLMARNGFQVLGKDLKSPSEFVICWTKDGKASGGSGQAIRIAKHHGIKVYNLKNESDVNELRAFLKSLEMANTNESNQ